ncbi:DUF4192 domain-containing protein [Stackebrandtia nassauensis]|uniref:DUF4192 domain-containing protein n=1 Tax=Stackebrandtia nassauensis (strain DSM 44728 / CIP 108903 / NRRL B-16338 / NBRC 102104 / LLR-40K-21) TaxID=446470 RepID=D3PV07_STANL|nr:DUF4192 domain-containing protein [Stackebrandtia nassauensis]ADD45031.1 hypothetical protein Snas_5399 [Stackebrandtia nassauensis DSM 44728]
MNTTSSADITLSSPADLVAAIPHLVGYRPTDSAVLVGLDEGHIKVTLRADLPLASGCFDVFADVITTMRRNDATAVVLVGFGEAARVTPVVDHLLPRLHGADIEVLDAIRVTGGTFWSYVCPEPTCCPPEGKPVPRDSRIEAAFVGEGMVAAPDRNAVAAQIDPVDFETRNHVALHLCDFKRTARLDRLVNAKRDRAAENTAKLAGAAKGVEAGTMPGLALTAKLGWAIAETSTGYKTALAIVDAGDHAHGLALWIWLARHHTGIYRSRAAAMTAYAAWRRGNGVLAGEAVGVALRLQPTCRLAQAVGLALSNGFPPAKVPPFSEVIP